MKTVFVIIILMAIGVSASAQQSPKARVIKLPELQKIINDPGTQVRVVNFWATWCAPCIKELPLFEKLHQQCHDVEVMLVSMDMDLDPNPGKVQKFVTRKKLQSPVFILDEANPNSYIDKIEAEWSGALPATMIVNSKTGKRTFVEHELHEGELEKLIDEVR